MKTILVFPPLSHPAYPYLSTPLLVGQLLRNGFDAESFDYNLEFFNYIFSKDFISQTIQNMKLYKNASKSQWSNLKADKINEYLTNKMSRALYTLKYIEEAVQIIKGRDFYSPQMFIKAYRIFKYAIELISISMYPQELSLGDYHNDFFKLDWNDINFQATNVEVNPFITFYKNTIDKIISKKPKLIGISVTFDRQIVPAFTLAKILKSKTDAHITIGGNLIGRIEETILKHSEILSLYTDSIMTGDGEQSILQLVNAIKNKTSLSNVNGLIYTENYKIKHNKKEFVTDLSKVQNVDLRGLKLSDYYTPEITFPMQLSKGCYWGKCTFCDYFHGKPVYYKKTIDKILSDIEELQKKYGINNFEFVDEAIPPDFYCELADAILAKNLKINYYSMARIEKGFTKELLKKLYKSGLRMLDWGFESVSPRIMRMMNKGIDIEGRYDILQNSASVGIWNHLFIMFGFPTESSEELQSTIDFLQSSSDYIDSYTSSIFVLRKHSKINEYLESFNILNKADSQDCSINYSFSGDETTLRNKDEIILKFNKDKLIKNTLSSISFYMIENYLFLYLLKWNRKFVKKIKIN